MFAVVFARFFRYKQNNSQWYREKCAGYLLHFLRPYFDCCISPCGTCEVQFVWKRFLKPPLSKWEYSGRLICNISPRKREDWKLGFRPFRNEERQINCFWAVCHMLSGILIKKNKWKSSPMHPRKSGLWKFLTWFSLVICHALHQDVVKVWDISR